MAANMAVEHVTQTADTEITVCKLISIVTNWMFGDRV